MDPYPRSKFVAPVSKDDSNPLDTMIDQQAQIIALLTEIRDNQIAVQADDGQGGKLLKILDLNVNVALF